MRTYGEADERSGVSEQAVQTSGEDRRASDLAAERAQKAVERATEATFSCVFHLKRKRISEGLEREGECDRGEDDNENRLLLDSVLLLKIIRAIIRGR